MTNVGRLNQLGAQDGLKEGFFKVGLGMVDLASFLLLLLLYSL